MSGLFAIVSLAALVGVFKPYINGVKRWQFGLAAFIAFVMIGVFAEPAIKAPSAAEAAKSNAGTPAETPSSATTGDIEDQEGEWSYSSEKDQMRGEETRYAELQATNTISLDFPYGEQRGRILVRQSPKFGFDILVGVPSGQIMCHAYSNAHVNVKFDDGPIERYACSDASDGTSNMVFIQGAKGFLAKLKKSRKAIIEAEFFQNGMQQMTFKTANLKWEQ